MQSCIPKPPNSKGSSPKLKRRFKSSQDAGKRVQSGLGDEDPGLRFHVPNTACNHKNEPMLNCCHCNTTHGKWVRVEESRVDH